MNHEIKKEETSLEVNQRITVENILDKVPVDELLGSVTTYPEGNDKNQSLRSSARVFKKIKLDANLTASNSLDKTEKKEETKPELLSKTEQRKQKPIWSAEDRALFFEALNEYGKDFENMHAYIVQKLKKKGVPDDLLITKDHVRRLYYKTWHKISKYLKFSEGTKKTVQELYGLINYGELRRKVIFTQKSSQKLNELIYNGCVNIRTKGKMVKVKTPTCAALRRLNKFDDKDEELKLPSRVIVELRPKDMSSFLKVQSFALNPRIRTVLPLQKKLSTLISCISKRWRAAEVEYLKNTYPIEEIIDEEICEKELDIDSRLVTSQLTFTPPTGTKVNLPQVNISEYFARESLCLKVFEERMAIERTKCASTTPTDKKENKKPAAKTRNDSFSDIISKSPVKSEVQIMEKTEVNYSEPESIPNVSASIITETANPHEEIEKVDQDPCGRTGDETIDNLFSNLKNMISSYESQNSDVDTIHCKLEDELLCSPSREVSKQTKEKQEIGCLNNSSVQYGSKTTESQDNNETNVNISAEEQLRRLKEIQNGWTVENCDTLTIGELYLMFGSSSKVVLEYHWSERADDNTTEESNIAQSEEVTSPNEHNDSWKHNFGFTDALRKLVSLIKFQQKKIATKCPCGHACSLKNAISKKSNVRVAGEAEEKLNSDDLPSENDCHIPVIKTEDIKSENAHFEDFLKPQSKPPPVHLMAQLDSIQKLKPKYTVRKGRRVLAKQLVVGRELPLTPKANSAHQIVRMNIISQTSNNNESQTEDNCELSTQVFGCEMEILADRIPHNHESDTQNLEEVRDSDLDLNTTLEVSEQRPPTSLSTDNLSALLQDSTRSLSPSGILKENINNWMSSEVGDFSLSSFLGHLDSPMKLQDDVAHDVDCQVSSLLTENSFDYTAKFADLANKVTSDSAN